MKLYEFEGKKILKSFGVPVPVGSLLYRGDPLPKAPVVLKAQALSGGRGKAGLIKVCKSDEEVASAAEKLFDAVHRGEKIQALWAEGIANIEREYYVSFSFDGETGEPLIMVSASGGVEIENVALEHPERILKIPFDIFYGPADYQYRHAAEFLDASHAKELAALMRSLYKAWRGTGATLVEINPLTLTDSGLMALDAKVDLDDGAEKAHSALFAGIKEEQSDHLGRVFKAANDTITYVQMEGDVGLISDGAGTGMLVLDMISDLGGSVADFCELGGLTNAQVAYDSLDKVFTHNPDLKSVLVVLIGGFNRMDEMAEGIVRYCQEKKPSASIVVRLCGTKEEEGKKIMSDAGMDIYDDLLSAVKAAVEKSKTACAEV